jgi:competence protein ComEA
MDASELKRFFKDMSNFTPSEYRDVFLLILIASGLLFLNFFYKKNNTPPILFSNADIVSNTESEYSDNEYGEDKYKPKDKKTNAETHFVELKKFDPNTASVEELVSLGIHPKTANTIIKFREKGGKFFKKEDLKKIYGLKEESYKKLETYIVISNKSSNKNQENFEKKETYAPVPKKTISSLEVNSSTPEEYELLNGIGKFYANKIVNFRTKLGGFYIIDQVGETYGIPDSVFKSIKSKLIIDISKIKKMNVNTSTFEELDAHPYIAKWQAEDIVKYRTEKGKINNEDDLKKIKSVNKNIDKIKPYITY